MANKKTKCQKKASKVIIKNSPEALAVALKTTKKPKKGK
jgi:hypothetical protein